MSAAANFVRVLGVLVAALLSVAAVAPPATADDLWTKCSGTLRDVHLAYVYVVSGEACTLDHVFASTLSVGSGASATLRSSEVYSRTSVNGELFADATTFGTIDLNHAALVRIDRATVRGSIHAAVGTFALDGVTIGGDLHVRAGDTVLETGLALQLDDVRVRGSITSDGLQVTASDLTVAGDVLVADAVLPPRQTLGVSLCGVDVAGELRVARSHWIVSVGAHPYGDPILCDPARSPSTVGALTFADNPHSIAVAGTTVAGDLVCRGNTGPRGVQTATVQVGGARVGQCAPS
ncbi:hypothetical protein [Cellulomonas sp. NS3]|uniref:hypothetical protein n=1 Tax=Cellulomonas sp. NS3 TaxID=2973977 RepID=UPI002162A46C|nr:hypothetical protein [Cellulomonas sp. NS3]